MAKSLNLAGRILLIGIGLAGLLKVGGCATQQPEPVLTQEQQQKDSKFWQSYMTAKNEKERKDNEFWQNYMIVKSQQEKTQSVPQNDYSKSQEERDADVVDGIKERVGADLAFQGILQAISDYSK